MSKPTQKEAQIKGENILKEHQLESYCNTGNVMGNTYVSIKNERL